MNKNNNIDYIPSESDQEINLVNVYSKLKRNFYLILSITTLSTIFSIIFAKNEIPIYSGQFQILVREETKQNLANSIQAGIIPKRFAAETSLKITQELILKSPLVLNPVYEFAKSKYLERGEDISRINYKDWVDDNLSFRFKDDISDVFEITFEDRDKNLIISTLNMISEKYKIYSKRDYNKNLSNELNYLKAQEKIYKEKYEESFQKYSQFVVENNLYVSPDIPKLETDLMVKSDFPNVLKNQRSDTRIPDHFSLLKQYEVTRMRYAAKLKPNSRFMRNIDSRIIKLKKVTEKPTRILLLEKELSKKMMRNESILEGIKNKIILNKLTSAKQKDPWELISLPTLSEKPVYPKLKIIVLVFFLISFFTSIIISLLKENFVGNIDDIDLLKSKLKAHFFNTLDSNNNSINAKIIDLNIKKILLDNINEKGSTNKTGIFYFQNISLISNYIESNKEISFIDFSDSEQINNIQDVIIFIERGKITYKNINLINKYIDLFPEKNFYWICLENENI
tara:strand:+ start:147 stop:1679 length:1533 start_codon:yes stop_codon:yes gene_type:complete